MTPSFKKILFTIIILTMTLGCEAQQESPNDIVNNFFNIYKTNEKNKALDYIFSTNKFISQNDISIIKNQIKQYSDILGKYYDKELFIKKNIGKSIEVHTYILKYERQPIRFVLTFYKPNNQWKIHNFIISDDFVSELEKATIELYYKDK